MPPARVVIRRQLKRRTVLAFFQKLPPCPGWHRGLRLVSHLVARAPGTRPFGAIDAAAYVKPYVKGQKNDATDAEVICEATKTELAHR